MSRRLSPRATSFVRESITSLDELETILLLHRDAGRWWSAEQIAGELEMRVDATSRALEALAARNLLDVRVGSSLTYCWAPIHHHDDVYEAVREVSLEPLEARRVIGVCSPNVSRSRFG